MFALGFLSALGLVGGYAGWWTRRAVRMEQEAATFRRASRSTARNWGSNFNPMEFDWGLALAPRTVRTTKGRTVGWRPAVFVRLGVSRIREVYGPDASSMLDIATWEYYDRAPFAPFGMPVFVLRAT